MASAYTLCTGPIAGAVSIGKGRVLVSVQGDGVSCYDTSTQVSIQAKPSPAQEPLVMHVCMHCSRRLLPPLLEHPCDLSRWYRVPRRAHPCRSPPFPPAHLQKRVLSWPLGNSEQEFSSGVVYDYASNQCFAPVRPRGSGPGSSAP